LKKDHNKIVHEHERKGSKNTFRYFRQAKVNQVASNSDDFEDGDEEIASSTPFQSIKAPYHKNYLEKTKHLNNTSVRGLIHKNVGRKWDDVFSEFCSIYDKRSPKNAWLFEYLLENVCTRIKEQDGELYKVERWSIDLLSVSWIEWYVDPRDGILKYNENFEYYKTKYKRQGIAAKAERAKNIRVVDKLTEYHKIDNIWWEIKFVEQEGYHETMKVGSWRRPHSQYTRTYIEYHHVYDILKKEVGRFHRYAKSKRTLSKKEIRNNKLNVILIDAD
jgi:hypothetical protein